MKWLLLLAGVSSALPKATPKGPAMTQLEDARTCCPDSQAATFSDGQCHHGSLSVRPSLQASQFATQCCYTDAEGFTVHYVDALNYPVTRGTLGTSAVGHYAGDLTITSNTTEFMMTQDYISLHIKSTAKCEGKTGSDEQWMTVRFNRNVVPAGAFTFDVDGGKAGLRIEVTSHVDMKTMSLRLHGEISGTGEWEGKFHEGFEEEHANDELKSLLDVQKIC